MVDAKIKVIKTINDFRGSLSVIEWEQDLGFEVKRTYYLHNLSGDERGKHAHKELYQFMIAIKGSFDVHLTKKGETKKFHLSSASEGLLVPPGHWRLLDNFSEDAVCIVFASDVYSEDEYIRNYEEFLAWEKDQ